VSSGNWTAQAVEELEREGKRSQVRRAVVEKLGEQQCAVSAVELNELLRADGHPVGRATVYRALERLIELGFVERLDLGVAGTRYEPARHGPGHHHHVVCEQCGDVAPFSDKGLERAITKAAGALDFDMTAHEIVLRGLCGRCKD